MHPACTGRERLSSELAASVSLVDGRRTVRAPRSSPFLVRALEAAVQERAASCGKRVNALKTVRSYKRRSARNNSRHSPKQANTVERLNNKRFLSYSHVQPVCWRLWVDAGVWTLPLKRHCSNKRHTVFLLSFNKQRGVYVELNFKPSRKLLSS